MTKPAVAEHIGPFAPFEPKPDRRSLFAFHEGPQLSADHLRDLWGAMRSYEADAMLSTWLHLVKDKSACRHQAPTGTLSIDRSRS